MLGLPLHPLVVHAVVVLLPLAALGVIAAVASPRFRRRYGRPVLGLVLVAAVSSVVARFSGESLAHQLTEPEGHERWGTLTMVSALTLAVLAVCWWALQRRDARHPGQRGLAALAAGALTVGAALASLSFVVLAGHSGSEATWTHRLAAQASPASSTEGEPTPTYSLAEVAEHATEQSCWAAVDGGVYDLTDWIAHHPGGRQRILALCGTDATERFRAQHDDASRPNTQLARFRIGDLA